MSSSSSEASEESVKVTFSKPTLRRLVALVYQINDPVLGIKASDAVGDMSDEVLIRFLRGRVAVRRDEAFKEFCATMRAISPDIL